MLRYHILLFLLYTYVLERDMIVSTVRLTAATGGESTYGQRDGAVVDVRGSVQL